mmetsp:Transcript_13720/g.20199  ORF Transcript_13720/g.20199 Transcript_13720/m.20199 type:complete len:122 (-) Transcript_13720:350-715(-)|eukprot:CAMPEP_0113934092 /NCGR_PEP_ID=MMETSP1339-20121228/1413_1 /TAXON_ID=94617 /ORGANISM="Fibrocapsa japonica" /LENGTH=121 /DNA_ID=CAMNT_0000935729 /DNA_START=50 /DNA_END=415 /DNA_ORIENTATION=+ /assembly_acc=CAM_ASM_000762
MAISSSFAVTKGLASAARTQAPSLTAVVRFISAEAPKAAEAAPAPAPATAPKSGGSSLFQRLGSFFVGVGIGATAGAYYLKQDIEDSTATLNKSIAKCVASNNNLAKKVAALENQVNQLGK